MRKVPIADRAIEQEHPINPCSSMAARRARGRSQRKMGGRRNNPDGPEFLECTDKGGSSMEADAHFFLIWAHASADGGFGPASKPVTKNGSFVCFPNEANARAECDRLNASGGVDQYSVRPTRLQALKLIAERFSVLPSPATSACSTFLGTDLHTHAMTGAERHQSP
jgi:hypothetical protein